MKELYWIIVWFAEVLCDTAPHCEPFFIISPVPPHSTTKLKCTSASNVSSELGSLNLRRVSELSILNSTHLYLSPGIFKYAESLKCLRINYNGLDRIEIDIFQNLPALTQLDLSDNGIKSVSEESFLDLPSLVTLNLRNNRLRVISRHVFDNLTVKDLIFSKNLISSVEDMALENLPNLEKLKLDHNNIKIIYLQNVLSFPEKLEVLVLNNNALTVISNYMLQRLTNLIILNLSFNWISYIEQGAFQQTMKLLRLVLSHNHLKEIDGSIFPRKGLGYLKSLWLDHNYLMFLSSNTFFRLRNLENVTLVGNPWHCPCLTAIHKLLFENGIEEKCTELYYDGSSPICVAGSFNTCRYEHSAAKQSMYESQSKMSLLRESLDCDSRTY